jgi:hypothetical protein
MNKDLIIKYFKEGRDQDACREAGVGFLAEFRQISRMSANGGSSPLQVVDQMANLRSRILMTIGEDNVSLPIVSEKPKSFEDYITEASGLPMEYKIRAFDAAVDYLQNRFFLMPSEHYSTAIGRIIEEAMSQSQSFENTFKKMLTKEVPSWDLKIFNLENVERIYQWQKATEKPNQLILKSLQVILNPKTDPETRFEYLEMVKYHLKAQGYIE